MTNQKTITEPFINAMNKTFNEPKKFAETESLNRPFAPRNLVIGKHRRRINCYLINLL